MMLRIINRKIFIPSYPTYMLFGDRREELFETNSKCEIKMKLDLLGAKIGYVTFQRLSGKLYYADIELV